MSEFMLIFRGREPFTSPEQMQKTTAKWVSWYKELGASGALKDPGRPLEPTGSVVRSQSKVITDGPFAEAKDVVGGYLVLEAPDLKKATEISKGCPIFDVGGSVEIREVQIMNL